MNTSDSMNVWNRPLPAQLLAAFSVAARTDVLPGFLRDIMTEKEITEMAARLEAARLLTTGASYVVIQEQTKLSTRTIARIALWLKQGANGYASVLESLTPTQPTHIHISPVRAE